ncbi:MAG: YihY/virulence factor BrkB family protein [Candidatus Latescibacteria bacterium]|jgi:membrane protein|nr:YihY/virulence factor BrkB family protein [Candidatus Latescibacterota bacterium]MBT4140818.1 YihY/virulence factor BrkB family protein [Candidatus Latescibacterota bacterium]
MGPVVSRQQGKTARSKQPVADVVPGTRRSPWLIVKQVFGRVINHGCTEISGEMAFDFLFAIFPAALFTSTLIVYIGVPADFVSNSLDLLGIFLHAVFRQMIEDNIRTLVASSTGSHSVLTFGLLGAIWVGSSAVSATIKALNKAYGVKETRSFLRLRLLSLQLMIGAGLAMILAFNLLIMGSWIEDQMHRLLPMGHLLPNIMGTLKWPAGFMCAAAMAGMLYRSAPNCRPRIFEVLPGAALFTILWYFLSEAFGAYVGNFSYYNMMTGLLQGFIVLLLWIYLTALFLLIGGELNAELANGKYADSSTGS